MSVNVIDHYTIWKPYMIRLNMKCFQSKQLLTLPMFICERQLHLIKSVLFMGYFCNVALTASDIFTAVASVGTLIGSH